MFLPARHSHGPLSGRPPSARTSSVIAAPVSAAHVVAASRRVLPCARGWLLALLLVTSASGEDTWRTTTWADGPAWSAEIGEATAIVSASLGRLIWFGPRGGDNLLYVPAGGALAIGEATLYGGHQFWLGPQERWRWPPPTIWEAAAVSHQIDGALLTLRLPAGDAVVPGIIRTYRIEAQGLRCGVRWSDGERPWHAMHVVQVPRAMRLDPVVVHPTDDLPQGCRFDVEGRGDVLPMHCSFAAGDTLELVPATLGAKIFLPPQPLRGVLGEWALTVHPGEVTGRPAGTADHGLNTQVYLAQPHRPYLELEQCSNLLLPGSAGHAAMDVVLSLSEAR